MDATRQLEDLTIVFPIHPRTKRRLEETGLQKKLKKNVRIIKPLKYREMLNLMKNAKLLLTDSGGMQKEAFWLETPCVTLRNETEWVEIVEVGCNILTGADKQKIIEGILQLWDKDQLETWQNFYGDGNASGKISRIINEFIKS